MKNMRVVLLGVCTMALPIFTQVAAQKPDSSAIVQAVVERLVTEAHGQPSALLATFVTSTGPARNSSGEFRKLPITGVQQFVIVDPPGNRAKPALKAWTTAMRRFGRLYSIGDIVAESDSAHVTVYTREMYVSDGQNMAGLTTSNVTLKKTEIGWSVVRLQPVITTTVFENQ